MRSSIHVPMDKTPQWPERSLSYSGYLRKSATKPAPRVSACRAICPLFLCVLRVSWCLCVRRIPVSPLHSAPSRIRPLPDPRSGIDGLHDETPFTNRGCLHPPRSKCLHLARQHARSRPSTCPMSSVNMPDVGSPRCQTSGVEMPDVARQHACTHDFTCPVSVPTVMLLDPERAAQLEPGVIR